MPHNDQKNDEFVQRLQAIAHEQHELSEHDVFPKWLAPVNAAIARNALPFVLVVSLCIAMVLFTVFFPFFLQLEGRLI